MLLGAAAPSLCAPVDKKIDLTVEIQIDSSYDGGFALESSPLHAPHPNSKSELDHGSHAASKSISTTDYSLATENNFTLWVKSRPVGPSTTRYEGSNPILSILDTKSEAASFSLDKDGHLKLGNESIQAFGGYGNAGLAGEYLVLAFEFDSGNSVLAVYLHSRMNEKMARGDHPGY